MSSDERQDSLAAQAAAWVPPWERAPRRPDREFQERVEAEAGEQASEPEEGEELSQAGLSEDDDDFDPAFEGPNPRTREAEGDESAETPAVGLDDAAAVSTVGQLSDPGVEEPALGELGDESAGVDAPSEPGDESAGVDAPAGVPGREGIETPPGAEMPLPEPIEEAAEAADADEPGTPVDAPLPAEGDDAADVFDSAADDDVSDDGEMDLLFADEVPPPNSAADNVAGRTGHAAGRGQSERAGGDRAEGDRAESDRAESDRAESDRAESDRAESDRAESDRAESDRAESDRAESDRAESDRAESDRAGSERAEGDRAGSERAEGDRAESDRAGGDRAESDRAEGADARGDRLEGAGGEGGADEAAVVDAAAAGARAAAEGEGEPVKRSKGAKARAVPGQKRRAGEPLGTGDESSPRTGNADVDLPGLTDDAELAGALEAIMLVVDEPVGELQLAQILEQPTERIAAMLDNLSARYTAAGHGFDLRRVAGGWRLYTRPEYAAYVERFVLDGQSVRLTQAALETLAVVAYKQPVTRSRISAIRGVNCDGVMRTLATRGLIEECGTESETGAHLYRTTGLFLEKLGLNSVDQLPPLAPFLPDDVEEVLDATG